MSFSLRSRRSERKFKPRSLFRSHSAHQLGTCPYKNWIASGGPMTASHLMLGNAGFLTASPLRTRAR